MVSKDRVTALNGIRIFAKKCEFLDVQGSRRVQYRYRMIDFEHHSRGIKKSPGLGIWGVQQNRKGGVGNASLRKVTCLMTLLRERVR